MTTRAEILFLCIRVVMTVLTRWYWLVLALVLGLLIGGLPW